MLPRERFALIWLVGLVLIPTSYFVYLSLNPAAAEAGLLYRLGLLGAALTALAIVALCGRFLTLGLGPQAKAAITDERDRRIESHSTSVAYQVLMGGMILVGFVLPFSAAPWDLVHAAFGAIVLAEIVHYSLVLFSYRRGLSG